MSSFRMVVSEGADPVYEINGVPVDVRGVSILIEEGNPSIVNLDFVATDVSVELDPTLLGSVFGINVLSMINQLSVGEIEEKALTNQSYGDSAIQMILNYIIQRAEDEAQS